MEKSWEVYTQPHHFRKENKNNSELIRSIGWFVGGHSRRVLDMFENSVTANFTLDHETEDVRDHRNLEHVHSIARSSAQLPSEQKSSERNTKLYNELLTTRYSISFNFSFTRLTFSIFISPSSFVRYINFTPVVYFCVQEKLMYRDSLHLYSSRARKSRCCAFAVRSSRETENCVSDLRVIPSSLFQVHLIIHTVRNWWHWYRNIATNPTYQSAPKRFETSSGISPFDRACTMLAS